MSFLGWDVALGSVGVGGDAGPPCALVLLAGEAGRSRCELRRGGARGLLYRPWGGGLILAKVDRGPSFFLKEGGGLILARVNRGPSFSLKEGGRSNLG